MARSADDSTSDWLPWSRNLAVVAVFVLIGSSLFVRSSTLDVGMAMAVTTVSVLAAIGLLLGMLWRRSAKRDVDHGGESGDSDEGGDADEDADVWNAIPPWQYDGRHVESGGLARGEQEQALQEIQEQADELVEDPSRESD